MSQADVELVRQWWAEAAGLDAAAAVAHWSEHVWADDIVWRPIEGAPDDHGPMHGRDRLVHYYEDWFGTFDDIRVEPREFVDAGEGRVIVVQRSAGRAKVSGVPVDLTYAVLYTLRDGRVASGREFLTRQEALAAAMADPNGPDATA